MGWAAHHIAKLQKGEVVQFRPHGHSMTGKIESGQLVTIEPLLMATPLEMGDIVLCKVKGNEYVHLISAVRDRQYQISNNKGHVNGWVTRGAIFGKCVRVAP